MPVRALVRCSGAGESTAPGATSAARAGVRVSFAGRSAVLRRGRSGPALLRDALRCSCRAVACGDRGVSHSTWADGLLFGDDGVPGLGFQPHAGDASPAPRPPRSPRQSRLRSRTPSVPSCPASFLKVSRGRRPAVFGCPMPPVRKRRILFDSPPPPSGRVAHPCRRGASPHAIRDTRASESRGTWASATISYGCPANAGFPPAVWSPSLSEWLPTTATIGQPRKRRRE